MATSVVPIGKIKVFEKKGEKIVLLLEGEKEIDVLKEEIKALGLNPLFVPSNYFKVEISHSITQVQASVRNDINDDKALPIP